MRRIVAVFCVLCLFALAAQAQDAKALLETFKRNFAIASLDVKIQILQDAASSKSASDMGPLYHQAVDFVLDNASLVTSDARFRQLASLAADQISAVSYKPAKYSIWKLFQTDAETTLRVRTATAIGVTGVGDNEIVQNMNRFLEGQNAAVVSGKPPDLQVIAATVTAMGKLGDPSSFPVLFTAENIGYSDEVAAAAKEALFSIKGDLKEMFMGVIKTGSIAEKKLALTMALANEKLSSDQKGQLAEFALDVALHTSAPDNAGKEALRAMRFTSAQALRERKWAAATPLLMENLDMTIVEYDRGLADKRCLLEAVAALGAVGTHEAAVRLTQYLVLLNSYTEKGKGFDEQIVLTLLDNIGALGDKIAFDDLMYTQYLGYSAPIKKSARVALEKLKW